MQVITSPLTLKNNEKKRMVQERTIYVRKLHKGSFLPLGVVMKDGRTNMDRPYDVAVLTEDPWQTLTRLASREQGVVQVIPAKAVCLKVRWLERMGGARGPARTYVMGPHEWIIDAEGCIVLSSPMEELVKRTGASGDTYVVSLAEHRRMLTQNLARFATFH